MEPIPNNTQSAFKYPILIKLSGSNNHRLQDPIHRAHIVWGGKRLQLRQLRQRQQLRRLRQLRTDGQQPT
uniref:Uncharacterized protein n=1 Tax=Picea glauca TaxID=3330 RepID=A0A101LXZ8_PICGL|nr:hypothetical protein ABT39_MTgene5594 [Picea glauca]QHR89595.1 hypothetical protein Q903MT_gene3617 [Picea sitchensis]